VDEIKQYLKLTVKGEGEGFLIPISEASSRNQTAEVRLQSASIYIRGHDVNISEGGE